MDGALSGSEVNGMSTSPIVQAVDDRRGHVVVHVEGSPFNIAVLVDMGVTVRIDERWIGPWTEEEARSVGSALIRWAGRKRLAIEGLKR